MDQFIYFVDQSIWIGPYNMWTSPYNGRSSWILPDKIHSPDFVQKTVTALGFVEQLFEQHTSIPGIMEINYEALKQSRDQAFGTGRNKD